MHGEAIPHAINAHEENQLLAIIRLRQDQDRTHLSDRFRQNRRRERRRRATLTRQVPLVQRDILDAHDPLVGFQLRDPIDEQKRVAVRNDALDRTVIQRQRQRFHWGRFSIIRVQTA